MQRADRRRTLVAVAGIALLAGIASSSAQDAALAARWAAMSPSAQAAWQQEYDAWAKKPSGDPALYDRLQTRTLPQGWDADLPTFDADPKGVATRKASGTVIQAIAATVPELWGGSADLAGSNNTTIEGVPSFLPGDRATKKWKADPLAVSGVSARLGASTVNSAASPSSRPVPNARRRSTGRSLAR